MYVDEKHSRIHFHFIPIFKFFQYRDLKGLIVTLDEFGQLNCSFLGTDPSIFVPASMERAGNFTVSIVIHSEE